MKFFFAVFNKCHTFNIVNKSYSQILLVKIRKQARCFNNNICNEFSFEHQNDHSVKNQVRAFFSNLSQNQQKLFRVYFLKTYQIKN